MKIYFRHSPVARTASCLLFAATLLISSADLFSQGTAINSTGSSPDNSAMLDVSSITQGFLMPRISLTGTGSALPVTAPAVSLMVYNNATAGDVTPGFYFWNSSNKWERFGSVSGTGSNGYIAFWNSATTLSYNSWLYYDATNHMFNLGSGASGFSGARLSVKSAAVNYDGIYAEHSSPTAGSTFSALSGKVVNAAYTTAQGYLGYHTSSSPAKTYSVYGKGGDWAGFFDAKVLIGNNTPSSIINTSDLEVQNTITGTYTPTPNFTIRQTTSLTTNGDTLGNLNFGDNYRALAQAQISVTRGSASSSSTDLPTDMGFSTTANGSDVLTERMRISNKGYVGIGTSNPGADLDVKDTLRISGSTSGYVGLTTAGVAGSTTYTLPSADGANGDVLKTNGSGTLSWGSAGGSSHFIGESYGGGVVYFVTSGGQHGLIAPLTEQSAGLEWSNVAGAVGAGAQSFTNGAANTAAIIAQPGHTSSSAYVCDTLNLNGYTDWYLPSITELNLMYNNWYVIGGSIYNIVYWSSTEVVDGANIGAYFNNFGNATQVCWNKSIPFKARCIRSF